jgi:penicillin amidase
VPGQPERYRFRGRVLDMSCRDEVHNYMNSPADVAARRPPERGTVTQRVCRTVHGPVQHRAGNVAYARRYAQWGRELESLEGVADINVARSVRDVDRAVRKFTWNENVMAIDSAGNIGFWHPGLFPLRPRKWDERLPFPGNGDAEWRGLLDRSKIPAVINPRQGWLANWNNLPADGWTSGDGTARKRMDGRFFRVHLLNLLVGRWARNPSFAGMQQVIRQAGTIAQQRYSAEPQLRRALTAGRGARGGAATVLRTLLNWGGSYHDTDSRNTVDPGVATWDVFRAEISKLAVGRFGPGAQFLAHENTLGGLLGGYHPALPYHYFEAGHLESYGLRVLGVDGYRAAAEAAYAALVRRFGSADPTRWREPRRMFDFQGLAGAQPPPLPFFDRGTWEQLTETGP